jgi:hypothetical protein
MVAQSMDQGVTTGRGDLGGARNPSCARAERAVSGASQWSSFDLVSGRPKILVNLTQARAQHVAFSAELLKLARIYE